MKKLFTIACLLTWLSPMVFAGTSDTSSSDSAWSGDRYGIGISAQINGIDTASIRYWQKRDWGVEGILGYNNYSNSTSATVIGGKYLRPIKNEKNLTLYGFAMLAFLNKSYQSAPAANGSTSTISASGTLVAAGLGVEFFFNELPNLGIGAELGLANQSGDAFSSASSNTKGTVIFSNVVNSIGLHYYFK